ncbi:GDSLlike lipase/acylhydrolase domain containing protein [Acanthamoeba castellanii str. Neff]|uniref:GDSLlike lipase/acylhydrolase domain containing protein n=1 Tax=Acanthamoeba castellanii (strain ATCC 30010 / Neff) TaxID=1257118 RepID=L8HBE1_ACACF|nr:GDSLlike lipase/acylhydrolase domain containing protein [Acanthamoeba castellanii str. Neff]ELR21706.1 GDSLlike lipase/acylhydrolase domain containing protein [Acanthamoeba castellanii str. Neff]
MRWTAFVVVVVALWVAVGAGQTVQYVGRVQQSSTVSGAVEFEWSNVEIHTSGKAIEALLDSNGNVFEVFVDGVSVGLINTTSGVRQYTVASGLSTGVTHSVVLRKRTEALFGVVTFHGFEVAGASSGDDGERFFIPAVKATMRPKALESRRIEFVGDSISCGYGIEGHPPCPFTAATENSGLTYGSLIAKSLSAELHLECWSGRGVVRNYGDKNITSAEPFPSLFPRTLPTAHDSAWHFGVWTPQAVVINLGTNDYSTQPAPPQDIFEEGYQKFVEYIYSQYKGNHETPHFFLACGPMISQPCCSYVKNVVDKEKAKGVNITYIDMQHILSPEDHGCAGHPSVSGHRKMAGVAGPVIKAAMGW